MRSLSSIILLLGLTINLYGQSPHGSDFKVNCAACHTSASWEIPAEKWDFQKEIKPKFSKMTGWEIPQDTSKFNHYRTAFPLEGGHATVDCRACHQTLVFAEASTDCISCHTDMHRGTVGSDCARCHATDNWLVDNITEIHLENGFPLLGPHAIANCVDCHLSESNLEFPRIGNECINCHLTDFNETSNPNHQNAGFSVNCVECHRGDGFGWDSETISHDFFPLEKGHEISDCIQCHTGGDFTSTPTDCIACHQTDFESTVNPNHQGANFSTNCTDCHTTDVGWMPAEYAQHDAIFPIYSGAHEGEWMQCTDCHNNPADFGAFTCITCHVNPETDQNHEGITGYVYESTACLACHPMGDADNSFDHNSTNFPLTGAHLDVDCIACHANGYAGTPTDCASCHTTDFNQTTNPNHTQLGLPTDCATCHTTEPGWSPASFDIHDEFYELNGAHAAISNDCVTCHNGDFNNTPNTCVGCHTADFNNTSNPNHTVAQFSTDCQSCHSEDQWVPATFDHDVQYFPIYSGAHDGEWNECIDCHTNPSNYAEVSCTNCHLNPETNNNHEGIGGYVYESSACLACHPTGNANDAFDHNMTNFPLTGAHLTVDCIECHANGYAGTPTDCASCHTMDFNQTTNPNHTQLGLPTDCATCHTTEPGWSPASFDIHNEFYVLNGAHAAISNDCVTCHNGDFNNTPNTCAGCHTEDFNNTTNPNHTAAQFSTDCQSCHSEDQWVPATFDHDTQYFPIYSGAHDGEWNDCIDCHTNPSNYAEVSCTNCHLNPETNNHHQGIGGYIYESSACLACHPTGSAADGFDHNTTNFPLTGAHLSVDCIECHANGYAGTPTDCASCHTTDFNQTTNPNHTQLGLPTDCATCHTTEPSWSPASFDIHNNYYQLNGAHAAISNDCATCHNGDYNNTPNTCFGCHESDYNNANNPDHSAAGFPTNCEECHTETTWDPSTFDHDDMYFPIYSGKHKNKWDECIDCHTTAGNFAIFDCINCHHNAHHQNQGNAGCYSCHPNGSE